MGRILFQLSRSLRLGKENKRARSRLWKETTTFNLRIEVLIIDASGRRQFYEWECSGGQSARRIKTFHCHVESVKNARKIDFFTATWKSHTNFWPAKLFMDFFMSSKTEIRNQSASKQLYSHLTKDLDFVRWLSRTVCYTNSLDFIFSLASRAKTTSAHGKWRGRKISAKIQNPVEREKGLGWRGEGKWYEMCSYAQTNQKIHLQSKQDSQLSYFEIAQGNELLKGSCNKSYLSIDSSFITCNGRNIYLWEFYEY